MNFGDLFTQGISATRDVLIARAGANDPTPNSRGANDVTAPVGQSASGFASAVMQPTTLLILAGVAALVFFIARK